MAVAAAAAYFIVWRWLASPFTPVPGDDAFIATAIKASGGLTLGTTSILNYSSPVYYLLAYLMLGTCQTFASVAAHCDAGEAVLYLAIASNAMIVLLLGLIMFRLTANLFAQIAVQTLYVFAAWPVTYHFMVSYSVTTAALSLLVLYLAIGRNRGTPLWQAGVGIVAALVLWSSSSGPLTAGLLVVTVALLLFEGSGWREALQPARYDGRRLAAFLAGFLVCAAFFGYFGLHEYIADLLHNVDSEHYTDASRKFGAVPEPPFFTYPRILGVYAPIQLLLLSAGLVAMLFIATGRVRVKMHPQTVWVASLLGALIMVHAVLIDLLPSTKLARAHFAVYPMSLIVIGVVGLALFRRLAKKPRDRHALAVFGVIVLAATTYEGTHLSLETRHVRTAAANYLQAARATADWYILREDPHNGPMWTTFNWPFIDFEKPGVSAGGYLTLQGRFKSGGENRIIRLVEAGELPAHLAKSDRKPIGLVLGPRGAGSGLSFASHATLDDFEPAAFLNFNALRTRIKGTRILPYYMHYPPFMMEEEICQALYFSGKIPDYRSPEMGIAVLFF